MNGDAMREATAAGVYPPEGGKWRGVSGEGVDAMSDERCDSCGELIEEGYQERCEEPDGRKFVYCSGCYAP
jgi:hypothetical protein